MEDLSVEKVVSKLRADYKALGAKLAAMPAVGSYSLDGLSVSVGDARRSLLDQQKGILEQLAQLGYPLGTISVPFQVAERLRG